MENSDFEKLYWNLVDEFGQCLKEIEALESIAPRIIDPPESVAAWLAEYRSLRLRNQDIHRRLEALPRPENKERD